MTDNSLSCLNEQQQQAATATTGRVRVVAGAGTGKTRVLTHRYAFLVNEVGIDPASILCLTFTNKAAQEMRNRIGKLVPRGKTNDFVCTIHGFCVKFLRQEIHRMGYPRNFTILDEADMKALARQAIDDKQIGRTETTAKKVLDKMGQLKSKPPRAYIDSIIMAEPQPADEKLAVEALVIKRQRQCFGLDFDDLVHFTLHIMERYPQSLAAWQQKITWVMVDEAQDCSTSDWAIINNISAASNNLLVVGDPDQAIYEWRGANVENFVNFGPDRDVILSQNYRSTPNILNVANSIIAHNTLRVPKQLFTNLPLRAVAVHHHAKSEADWIARKIAWLCDEQDFDFADTAILYRASHLSRAIEQALMQHSIRYTVWGGVRFFEREEIKNALAYLRLVSDTNDDLALQRIVNVPPRRFGKAANKKLLAMASEHKGRLYIPHFDLLAATPKEFARTRVSELVGLVDSLQRARHTLPVSQLIDRALNESGLMAMYRADADEDRLENLDEFLASVRLWEQEHADDEGDMLTNYLQSVALYTNADYKHDDNTVKLMTIHQSKGLEFPNVFVCGMSEGIFPSYRAIREREKKAEEEERRLMYVAVTRAQASLFLTESEGYNFNTATEKYPSRYFLEIGKGLVKVDGKIDRSLWRGTESLKQSLDEAMAADTAASPPAAFAAGTLVSSPYLGKGVVTQESQNGVTCMVSFGGKPPMSVAMAKLEKL